MRRRVFVFPLPLLFALALLSGCGEDDVTEPAGMGDLRVAVASAGLNPDESGYGVFVDGERLSGVGLNDTVLVEGVEAGTRQVELGNLDGTCAVPGESRVSVTLAPGGTEEVAFEVRCPPTADQGRVVFSRIDADGLGEIVLLDSQGERVIVDADGARNRHPGWSPDGARIVFESDRAGRPPYQIWTANADGSSPVRVTDVEGGAVEPAWSPDGTRIAFSALPHPDSARAIFTMSPQGDGLVQVTDGSAPDHDPAWSPDGTRIAYVRDADGSADIEIVDPDGGGLVRLTSTADVNEREPAWSPDGARIAFITDEDGDPDLAIIGVSGSGLVRFGDPQGAPEAGPVWNPDGTQLLFASSRSGEIDLYLVAATAGAATRVTLGAVTEEVDPDWTGT